MNEKEIINLIKVEETRLQEGVSSLSEYILTCKRIDALHNQLALIKSCTYDMKKLAKQVLKKPAKKKVVAKKPVKKVSKKK